jgi:hypothetical protein
MKGIKTTNFFGLIAVFIIAACLLSSRALASTQSGIRSGEIIDVPQTSAAEYVSSVFYPDFPVDVVGSAWQGSENTSLQIRFLESGRWTKWYESETDESQLKDGWFYSTEPILADQASAMQYKVAVSSVSRIKLIYIGADQSSFDLGETLSNFFSEAFAASELEVRSRSQWQADEKWRLDALNNEIWPAEYQWPEKFVIHHTAGSDGGSDPAAAIRGIYYWQAVVLGWGDIGYNYLIDQAGNIYEGRFGGDGVIGAHAYRDEACAKSRFGSGTREANFNKGTIGIAILGNYGGGLQLNNQVKAALTSLIGRKAKDFNIQPDGTGFFVEAVYSNIVGHGEVDCTDCPGKNINSQMSSIRQESRRKSDLLSAVSPEMRATYVSQSGQPVTVRTGQSQDVWVDFRNDSNFTWRSYQPETVTVLAKNMASAFYVAGWNSVREAARLTTPNVAPGEIGRFVFTIKGPVDQVEVREEFSLQWSGQVVPNTEFSVSALVSGLPNAAVLLSQEVLSSTFVDTEQTAVVKYRNMGTQIWARGDLKLNIYDLGDNPSRFYAAAWSDDFGQIDFQENEVKSGELATFIFPLRSPAQPGVYLNKYQLTDGDEIVQDENDIIMKVYPIWEAEFVSSTLPVAVANVWRPKVEIRYKNVGLATWDRSLVLKAYDLGDRQSKFHDPSWLDNFSVARLKEREVRRGETGTFEFYFKAPKVPGVYLNRFVLEMKGLSVDGSDFSRLTRVDLAK